MNKDIQDFIQELTSRENVLGVILFGSWARGNNRANSDVDLLVIVTDGYRRTIECRNTQTFEIIYTTVKAAGEFWQDKKDDCFGLWSVAKVLYDKDGIVEKLKQQAQEIINQGKTKIDEHQRKQYRFSAEDEIRAVEKMIAHDEATAYLVLSYTVNTLTSLFFDLREFWTPAPKQRLVKIKEFHPTLGQYFEEYYSDKNVLDKIEIVKKVVPLVFEDQVLKIE